MVHPQASATDLSIDWTLPQGVKAEAAAPSALTRPLVDGEHRVLYFRLVGEVSEWAGAGWRG